MTLESSLVRLLISLSESNLAGGNTARYDINSPNPQTQYEDGTGAFQGKRILAIKDTLTDGQIVDYDLSNLSTPAVPSDMGIVSFSRINFIAVINRTLTTGYGMKLGGGSNPFDTWLGVPTQHLPIAPGGWRCDNQPDDTGFVVNSTHKILRLTGNVVLPVSSSSSSSGSSSSSSSSGVAPVIPSVTYAVILLGV